MKKKLHEKNNLLWATECKAMFGLLLTCTRAKPPSGDVDVVCCYAEALRIYIYVCIAGIEMMTRGVHRAQAPSNYDAIIL